MNGDVRDLFSKLKGAGGPADFALFWDMSSLYQHPRTPTESYLYSEGLRASLIWASHQLTVSWIQPTLPPTEQEKRKQQQQQRQKQRRNTNHHDNKESGGAVPASPVPRKPAPVKPWQGPLASLPVPGNPLPPPEPTPPPSPPPPERPPYGATPWTLVESAASALLKPNERRLDISKHPQLVVTDPARIADPASWIALYQKKVLPACRAARPPPMVPSAIINTLRKSSMRTAGTTEADAELLMELYSVGASPAPPRSYYYYFVLDPPPSPPPRCPPPVLGVDLRLSDSSPPSSPSYTLRTFSSPPPKWPPSCSTKR